MSRYARGGSEPSLDEMLGDPVVRAVMARDGVTDERVRDALAQARSRPITETQPETVRGAEPRG